MKRIDTTIGLLRIPVDILAIFAALLLSFRLREANIDLIPAVQLLDPTTTLPTFTQYVHGFLWPSVLLLLVIMAMARLYVLQTYLRFLKEIERIFMAVLLWFVIIMTWYFLIQKQLFYSRIVLLHSVVFLFIFLVAGRAAIRILKDAFLRHGFGVIHIASIGTIPLATNALQAFMKQKRYEYNGHFKQLSDIQKKTSTTFDLIVQTDPAPQNDSTVALIDYCRSMHIEYAFLPPVFADVPHRLKIERIDTVLFLRFKPTPLDGWGKVLKRLFDVVLSLCLLVILSPIFLVVSIAILLESGWPIWYVSTRVGEKGIKTIPVLKFRSMVKNADALKDSLSLQNERRDGPLFKIQNDPRVTPLGKILRRFDIDELPQLVNVFLGHMSLIGPRPHLPSEVARYKMHERRVFAVKPGITGLAQVSGRSDLTFEEEVRLDLQYIEEWSIKKDIFILIQTALVVLLRGGK